MAWIFTLFTFLSILTFSGPSKAHPETRCQQFTSFMAQWLATPRWRPQLICPVVRPSTVLPNLLKYVVLSVWAFFSFWQFLIQWSSQFLIAALHGLGCTDMSPSWHEAWWIKYIYKIYIKMCMLLYLCRDVYVHADGEFDQFSRSQELEKI